MNSKIKLALILLTAVALVGIPGALAFPALNNACDLPSGGCHAYPPAFLNNTVSITAITVAPGQFFPVTINWTGGSTAVQTVAKWPNGTCSGCVMQNDLFNPNPVMSTLGINPAGTLTSTLTAPAAPGTYTLRAYTSTGTGAPNTGKETDYKVITVTVTTATPTPTPTPVVTPTPTPTETPIVTPTPTPIGMEPEVEAYDDNHDGRIDRNEAVRSVDDYFRGRTMRAVAIRVVVFYFEH
ncbi:Uncharacterised protein [uncultured archaeon]|nr:Uncharacterised protein [uncultured archaeon]